MNTATWIVNVPEKKSVKRDKDASYDWAALHALAVDADRQMSAEELELWRRGVIDGNARLWNVDYVHAAQSALEQRRPAQLLAMLGAEIPAPTFLLPIIADVIRSQKVGKPGPPPKLTQAAHEAIRSIYSILVEHRYPGCAPEEARRLAIEYLAHAKGVSEKTIVRSLAEGSST